MDLLDHLKALIRETESNWTLQRKKISIGDVTSMQAFKFYSRWSLKVFVHSNSLLIMRSKPCHSSDWLLIRCGQAFLWYVNTAKTSWSILICRTLYVHSYDSSILYQLQHSVCFSHGQSASGEASSSAYIVDTQQTRKERPFLPNGREACRRFNQANCVRPDCGLAHNCYILLWD